MTAPTHVPEDLTIMVSSPSCQVHTDRGVECGQAASWAFRCTSPCCDVRGETNLSCQFHYEEFATILYLRCTTCGYETPAKQYFVWWRI